MYPPDSNAPAVLRAAAARATTSTALLFGGTDEQRQINGMVMAFSIGNGEQLLTIHSLSPYFIKFRGSGGHVRHDRCLLTLILFQATSSSIQLWELWLAVVSLYAWRFLSQPLKLKRDTLDANMWVRSESLLLCRLEQTQHRWIPPLSPQVPFTMPCELCKRLHIAIVSVLTLEAGREGGRRESNVD